MKINVKKGTEFALIAGGILFLPVFCTGIAMAQSWNVPVNVSDGTTHIHLIFGVDPNARNGFDIHIDKVTPPPPIDPEVLYCYFSLNDTAYPVVTSLMNDIHGVTDTSSWILKIRQSPQSTTMSWNMSEVPANINLSLCIDDGSVINMRTENSTMLNKSVETIYITHNPILSWTGEPGYVSDGIEPDTGDTSTRFEYRIKYSDANNESPAFVKVWIDANGDGDYNDTVSGFVEGAFNMTEVDVNDGIYDDGKVYNYTTTLPVGTAITYKFTARDINGADATGAINVNSGPIVNDTSPPQINFCSDIDPLELGEQQTIIANVTDNIKVDTVLVEINGENHTMTPAGNNYTYSYTPISTGIVVYTIYANDTSGNNADPVSDNFTVRYTLNLTAGWSMISISVTPENTSADAILKEQVPDGSYSLHTWDTINKTYVNSTVIEPGKGYWIFVHDECQVRVNGTALMNYTTNLTRGWNMIGSVITITNFDNPDDIPDGAVLNYTYTWSPADKVYVSKNYTEPRRGYWALALQNCSLRMGGG